MKVRSSLLCELLLKFQLFLDLILYLISLLESLYPSHGVNYPLFACIKGVAFAAYLHPEFWRSGTNGEGIATEASHFSVIIILGMNFGFHL